MVDCCVLLVLVLRHGSVRNLLAAADVDVVMVALASHQLEEKETKIAQLMQEGR